MLTASHHKSFIDLMIMLTWAVVFISTSRSASRRDSRRRRPARRQPSTTGTMRVRGRDLEA